MFTIVVRDEQENMKVVYDWHTEKKPHFMSVDGCNKLVAELRNLYPNASKGVAFGYDYTGDDWSTMRPNRTSEGFNQPPDFRHVRNRQSVDCNTSKTALKTTLQPSRSKASSNKSTGTTLYACNKCSWKGPFKKLENRDTDSSYFWLGHAPSVNKNKSPDMEYGLLFGSTMSSRETTHDG